MKKPTLEEIQAEIAKLKALRNKIPKYTVFGDSNLVRIDAEIQALEGHWSEDDAYEELGTTEEGENRELDGALDAAHWMEGEEKEPCSKGWEALVK